MTYHTIPHPDCFKKGVRVILGANRHKDGDGNARVKNFVSKGIEDFDDVIKKAQEQGFSRIYVTLCERDTAKAMHQFKKMQLDNDLALDPTTFYHEAKNRWIRSLTKPTSEEKVGRLWLIDCDTPEEVALAETYLKEEYSGDYQYSYDTKNGKHFVCKPHWVQNKEVTEKLEFKKNAFMLWSWKTE